MSEPVNPWDERFAGEEYLFGEAPNAFLARQATHLPAHGLALAVADGEGRNGVWLAQQGLSVVSLDGSRVAQAKAKRLAERAGVTMEIVLADIAAWTWPTDRYDVVAAIFIQFADPQLRAEMFRGMIAALKPGGLLLLEGYGTKQLEYGTGGPRTLENLYTEEILLEAFGDLDIISLESYDAEISEGPRHVGMSALVDLVARKPA